MRLPLLSEPAPFTVAVTVHGLSMVFPAENAYVAAGMSRDFVHRDPAAEARWGPSAVDCLAWPVVIRLRAGVDFSGAVHLALLAAGYAVSTEIIACCAEPIAERAADFTGRGRPCTECLPYWRVTRGRSGLDARPAG